VAEHKKELDALGFDNFRKNFSLEAKVLPEFLAYAKKSGIKYNEKEYHKSKPLLSNQLKAYIARGVWKNDGFFPIYNESDEMFGEAVKLFGKAASLEKGKF
jgi:carboxyl-terminal processing protease